MPKISQKQLKTAGSIVLFIAAVGLFIHRIPKKEYAAVHADKPRPARTESASTVPAAPLPAVASPKPETRRQPARASHMPTSISVVQTEDSPAPTLDWREACAGETGILCNRIATRRLRSCLHRYDDVLRSSCREALNGKR